MLSREPMIGMSSLLTLAQIELSIHKKLNDMKTNMLKGLSALALLLVSGAASAQTMKFSADKVFLTPGETATVSMKLENDVDVKTFSGTITLPEGLSFVIDKVDDAGIADYVCEVGERYADAEYSFSGRDGQIGNFLVAGTAPSQGEGDVVFSFDVQADENLVATGDIVFSALKGAYGSKNQYSQDDFSTPYYSNDFVITPVFGDLSIAPGETKTISMELNSAEPLVSYECLINMPEGLTIDMASFATTDRTVNHKVLKGVRDNGDIFVGLSAKLTAEDNKFIGEEGAVLTFDVTADESLAESAQILVKDIMSCAMADLQPETPIVPFYSPDVLINVTNTLTSGINNAAEGRYSDADAIYSINGVRTKSLQRGVNIVKKDGKTIKVVKK